jgi:hypothetical protein
MSAVSFPVKVFCWLGWKQPTSTYGPTAASAACPNRGLGDGMVSPVCPIARRAPSQAYARAPRSSGAAQASPAPARGTAGTGPRSSGVGLLPGGAQRFTAVT